MRTIATAVAALALAAGVAHAQGNGRGNGQGNGGPAAGAAVPGGKGQAKGPGARAERQRGNEAADRKRDEPRGPQQARGPERPERVASSADRGRGNAARPAAADNRGKADARANGQTGRGRDGDSRLIVLDERRRDGGPRDVLRVRDLHAIPARGLVAGCPPGLARKNPPCVPPGQVRGPLRGFDRPDFWGLRLADGRYRYDGGYLVRLGPDGRIGGYVPLLGGALALGNLWPSSYAPVALPSYYETYYGLGPYESYRYADDVIYQVDPETAAITSVLAMLTGDTFAVGQPMPMGYDVYNVPYDHRDRYYDTPEALYRYSDGYVYEVDPETRLIAAAIELIAA